MNPVSFLKKPFIRAIGATNGVSSIEMGPVTECCVDRRAIGYRATSIGGREGGFEALAEMIARDDLEQELASALANGELMVRVFDRIFPKKETLRVTANQGLLTMPQLVEAYRQALTGENKSRTTLAQILAEVTAHSLKHLNLILPFDGFVTVDPHVELFPSFTTLIEAARVKRITDVLESLKMSPEIGKVKTLSAVALYSALQPMFTRAARALLQTVDQDMYLQDALLLLRLYVAQDPALPRVLANNDNLRSMSTNLTYVLASAEQPLRDLVVPEYMMADVISDANLRLRGLKRFETIHLDQLRSWYTHYTVSDGTGQRVVGLVFARNYKAENRTQVTVFNQISSPNYPVWTQTDFALAANRLDPVLSDLFSKSLDTKAMTAIATSVAHYLPHENEDQDETASVFFVNGSTERELCYYAAANVRHLVLNATSDAFSLGYVLEDTELNYRTQALVLGTRILTTDAAEAIIHSGVREFVGEGVVPTRIQGIPETVRQSLLLVNPSDFVVPLAQPINIKVDLNEIELSCETSVADLLMLPRQLKLSFTIPLANTVLVHDYVGALLAMADSVDITRSEGEIARLRAATALSNMLLSVSGSAAGRSITRAVFIKLMQSVPSGNEREAVRGKLRHAELSYKIALRVAAELLAALGFLTKQHADDILSLIGATGLERFMVGSVPNVTDLI